MFLTYSCAKIDQFGLFGDALVAWSYVEHTVHRPWFYVAAAEPGEDLDLHPMLMLSDEQLLRSLLDDRERRLLVKSVLLVTPDHINKSGGWLMERLDSVRRFKSSLGVAYAYQVAEGKTYFYGDREVPLQDESISETLFSTSMLSHY